MAEQLAASDTKPNRKFSLPDVIFAVILAAFPFLHVNTGLNLADVGYNLLNSTVFPDMNRTWAISTLLANVTGHVLSWLPGGGTALGMNIWCILLGDVFLLFFYYVLRKRYASYVVFLGLFIAQGFSWCPRVILYHYLSYYLFVCGTILLLTAIESRKKVFCLLAGAVLALNAFVRFPNVVECLLIVVLFYYGISEKKNILTDFLCCVAGYAAVFFFGVGSISLVYGKTAFVDMIRSLFGMTKEATAYTPKSMLAQIFGDYATYFKFFVPFLLLGVLGGILLYFIKNKTGKMFVFAGMGILFLGIGAVLYRRYGAFGLNYADYRSIFMWGTFLLMTAVFLAVYGMFRRDYPLSRRLFGVAVVGVILITPIGSNNGLYSDFNNLFLTAPYVAGELDYFFRREFIPGYKEKNMKAAGWIRGGLYTVALAVCAVTLLQGTLFGITFVFGDAPFVGGNYATIANNSVTKGMRTNAENAKNLQELNDYLEKEGLKNKLSVCYDAIPGIYYYLEEECALSHSWAGLDSFPREELEADLKSLSEGDDLPLFFYENKLGNLLTQEKEEAGDGQVKDNPKREMFYRFLKENGYREVFRNDGFVLCLPPGIVLPD